MPSGTDIPSGAVGSLSPAVLSAAARSGAGQVGSVTRARTGVPGRGPGPWLDGGPAGAAAPGNGNGLALSSFAAEDARSAGGVPAAVGSWMPLAPRVRRGSSLSAWAGICVAAASRDHRGSSPWPPGGTGTALVSVPCTGYAPLAWPRPALAPMTLACTGSSPPACGWVASSVGRSARGGRYPRLTSPGVRPWLPGTRRGSSSAGSCGKRLASPMRRHHPMGSTSDCWTPAHHSVTCCSTGMA